MKLQTIMDEIPDRTAIRTLPYILFALPRQALSACFQAWQEQLPPIIAGEKPPLKAVLGRRQDVR